MLMGKKKILLEKNNSFEKFFFARAGVKMNFKTLLAGVK
jgi:hypothetical protein